MQEFKANGGTLKFNKLDSSNVPTFQVEVTRKLSVTVPLGRHIRTLVEMYGYEEIKRLINRYPEELK